MFKLHRRALARTALAAALSATLSSTALLAHAQAERPALALPPPAARAPPRVRVPQVWKVRCAAGSPAPEPSKLRARYYQSFFQRP